VDSRDDGRADVATLVRARLASLSPQCILFHDDVEHGTNGWTTVAYLQDDLWHPTTRAWNSAGHAWWCGVEAKGTYETGRTIRNGLISPVIDLREVAAPVSLEYADNFAVEPLVDRCRVQINMVGSPIWFDLDNEAGSSGGWRLNVFDLSGFAGHQVRIQFLFETRLLADYYPGWFVDDVLVTSAPPKWVTADSDSGTTARGGSTDVQITFDTEGLIGGEYDAVLRVTSNDADESLVTVPTRLSVPAVPLLSVAPDTVTFDSTSIGSQTARSVMLRNIGTGDLNVNGLDVTPAVFGVPHDGLVLAPNASSSVALTFTPDRGGWSEGVMVVHSDDPENPDRRVPLRGFGLVPPDVEVSPDSLLVSVGYDERTDRTVQIANRGGQPLAWSVLRELTIAPAGAASTAAVRTRGLPATAGRRPGHGLRVPGGSGQVTALVKARLASVPASNIIFADDMEHGSSGWTVSGVDPLWHLTSQASNSGSFSWWCGVDSLYGYGIPRPVLTALVSTPIDLRGAQIPLRLEFAENYQTEWGWDDCAVHVTSDDGTTWQVLRWPTSGNSGGWQLTSLDLSPWAGQVIRFRFQFNTHDTQHNDYPGWFVDDVMVLSMAPTWMAVTPESGSLAGGGTADLQVSFTSAGLPDAA
jgi:hypothetical protein